MENTAASEANVQQAIPFFAVSNMQASVRHYVDGIGFVITQQWIDGGKLRWCRLQLGNAAIMLQEFRTAGHDAWAPSGKVGEGVTICFICTDALAIYHEVTKQGLQASEPCVGNGMWVTSLTDPDDYRLAFESYTDRPEGTRLSEPDHCQIVRVA